MTLLLLRQALPSNRLRCRGPLLTKRVIEKARVRATNLNTSESFAASTAANGLYTILLINPRNTS